MKQSVAESGVNLSSFATHLSSLNHTLKNHNVTFTALIVPELHAGNEHFEPSRPHIAPHTEPEGEAEAESEENLEGITARREQHGTVNGQNRMEDDRILWHRVVND
jgi:hypothetical protein